MRFKRRNQAGKALTAEFAVALTVFLLIALFPLINIIGFGMAAGTQYIMTVQCAGGAGASTSFNDALTAMDREANTFVSSGFGKFANLQPIGGHNGTGTDLYLIETNLTGANNVLSYGPNTGGPAVINQNNNVYEYQVRSTFDVGPFVNMSSMPWIGNVPGVGRPARLSFVAHRNCEFTEGLAMGATGTPIIAAAGSGGNTGGSGSSTGSGASGSPGSGTGAIASTSLGGGSTILASSSNKNNTSGSGGGGGKNKKKKKGGGATTSGTSGGQSSSASTSFNSSFSLSQSAGSSGSQTNINGVTQTYNDTDSSSDSDSQGGTFPGSGSGSFNNGSGPTTISTSGGNTSTVTVGGFVGSQTQSASSSGTQSNTQFAGASSSSGQSQSSSSSSP